MFPDSDLGRETIVRRRFYSQRESSSRARVDIMPSSGEGGSCGP